VLIVLPNLDLKLDIKLRRKTMCVVNRERLNQWFDGEMEELDRDLAEGRITEKQYNAYARNIREQYQEDINDIADRIKDESKYDY
jgi:hypothetical protein